MNYYNHWQYIDRDPPIINDGDTILFKLNIYPPRNSPYNKPIYMVEFRFYHIRHQGFDGTDIVSTMYCDIDNEYEIKQPALPGVGFIAQDTPMYLFLSDEWDYGTVKGDMWDKPGTYLPNGGYKEYLYTYHGLKPLKLNSLEFTANIVN